MYWTDAGSSPKVEFAWMDGSKRRTIATTDLAYPTGLTIDYAAAHRVYWADTKLDKIECSKSDGTNRVTILAGCKYRGISSDGHDGNLMFLFSYPTAKKSPLLQPVSLDVFERMLYWGTKQTNEIYKQDKHGRGVKVRVKRDAALPSSIKIYQEQKYSMAIKNRCPTGFCSHLCLLTLGGYRCACPDGAPLTKSPLGNTCNAGKSFRNSKRAIYAFKN